MAANETDNWQMTIRYDGQRDYNKRIIDKRIDGDLI